MKARYHRSRTHLSLEKDSPEPIVEVGTKDSASASAYTPNSTAEIGRSWHYLRSVDCITVTNDKQLRQDYPFFSSGETGFETAISELKSERLHLRPSAKGGRTFQFRLGPFERADSRVVPERRTNMSLILRPVNPLSLG
jgi:hypothetical protein